MTTRDGRGFLWWVAFGGICWLFYASMFDVEGNFEPTIHTDVIEWRIGYRLGNAAQRADDAVVQQNRDMQGAVHHRERRVNRKVEKQTGGSK